MKQTLVLIHRWLQEGIIEIIEEDVITAILKQKGLIVEIDDLSILKTITTTEEINKAIADMKADGEFNTLYKKWFNVDAPADMPVVLEFK